MAYEYRVTRQVEFGETDMGGIVHFPNYFRYMESVEHAFFRSIGSSVLTRQPEGMVSFPRVHVECDYKHPLRFEDTVEIHLLVRRKENKLLVLDFIFRKLNEEPPCLVARGSMTTVCARVDPDSEQICSMSIPPEIADRIQVAPPELLT